MRQHTFKTSPYPHTAYILLLNPSYGRSTFIVAEGSLLRASGPSVIQYYLVFLMVFGIEKYFDGMRYLHISPHNSGYGCDTSMYPNLLYHMIRDMISPSIPIYNAISHRITQKPKARTTSTKPTTLLRSTFCFGFLSLPSSCLVSRLAFFVVRLLPIRWTHHRTDRTTSKHQPCPLVIRPPTWVHDCFCCVFLFSIFPCLFSLLVTHIACYRYRDIPNIFLVVISIRTENIKISHDIPRSLDTIPNSSF